MQQKIKQDMENAMRQKDALRLSVLRMLLSAIHNREIEKRTKDREEKLTEGETVAAIRAEAKKRRDAIVEFGKGGREDLVAKESSELKILEEYLPQELPDEEIEKMVKEVVAETGMADSKQFGRVMGEMMKRVRGRASGDRLSAAVKKLLEN